MMYMGFGGLLNQLATTTAGGGMGAVVENYPVASGYSVSAGDVVDIDESGELEVTRLPVSNIENEIFKSNAIDTAVVKLNDQYSIAVFAGSSAAKGGQTVLINNSDGKAASMNWPPIVSGTVANVSLARLSDTQFVVGFTSGTQVFFKIGEVSGTTISFGGNYSGPNGINYCDVIPLSETSFLGLWNNDTIYNSGLNYLFFTANGGTSISWTTEPTKVSGIDSANNISATRLSDDESGNKRICVCFYDGNDGNFGKAVIATVNDANAVTWGQVFTFNASQTAANSDCCADGDDIILCYTPVNPVGVNKGTACILSVNGSTISKKSSITISDTTPTYYSLSKVGSVIVVNYQESNNGISRVLTRTGDTLSAGNAYTFNSPGGTNYISSDAISASKIIVCYADGGSSGYGTTTILEVNGTQIAGSFITNSTQAIALQSGNAGQTIPVCYSGIVKAPFVSQGDVISSSGVTGVGILDGVLQVYAKDAPNKIVTGSYVGTGTYGSSGPNELTFGFKPSLVIITGNYGNYADCCFFPVLYLNSEYHAGGYSGRAGNQEVPPQNAYAKIDGTTLSWYFKDSANQQLNYTAISYYYIALG